MKQKKLLCIRAKSAYTLAETLITIAIIAVITVLCIGVLNLKNIRQRELLARFDMSYSKLDNIVQMASLSNQKFNHWSSDQMALSNLTCKKSDGTDETNKSICLKKALMSVSNIPKDCEGEVSGCIADFSKASNQLKEIFPALKPEDLTVFTMPGGVTVLNSYLDSACQMDIPISKSKSGEVEYIKGCGFLLVDVNGDKKPNNLLISKTEVIDRFLLALTPKGVVKSNLISELAGCPEGTRYDSSTKTCKDNFNCPINMEAMREFETANPSDYIVRQYTYGADKADCYEVKCKTGSPNSITKLCPAPCKSDEVRQGGLWIKEGGTRPDDQEKDCCISVSNQAELANISSAKSRNYCLANDINLDVGPGFSAIEGWLPIPSFSGNFYGNGHVIRGLYVNRPELGYVGLFGNPSSKIIENVGIEGGSKTANIEGTAYNVVGNGNVGSICGYMSGSSSSLENVYNTSSIYSKSAAGGISSSSKHIKNAYNKGTVRALSGYTGGITGITSGNLQNVYNLGSVSIVDKYSTASHYNHVGGIVGSLSITGGTLKNAYNTGSISLTYLDSAAASNAWNYAGGLFASGSQTSVENLYNAGSIELNNTNAPGTSWNYIGGIGSEANSIKNAYNSAPVSLKTINASGTNWNYAGGIASRMATGSNIYSIGAVSTKVESTSISSWNIARGLIATSSGSSSVSNAFAIQTPVCDSYYMSGCQSKTEAELKQAATFSGWDRAVWDIADGRFPSLAIKNLFTYPAWAFVRGDSNPVLRWQCKPYRSGGFDCCGENGVVCP